MNFVPPGGDPSLEVGAARERERQIEMKAELHSRFHDDDDQRPVSAIRRAVERIRAAIRRGK